MDQFWSPVTNQRTDGYGGSLDNRMRFSRMVFAAMREAVGEGFALGVRMTMTEQDHDSTGLSEADNIEIASRLRDDGVIDFLNLVSGRIDSLPRLTNYMPGMAAPLSPFLEQAGRFRREVGLPVLHATRVVIWPRPLCCRRGYCRSCRHDPGPYCRPLYRCQARAR